MKVPIDSVKTDVLRDSVGLIENGTASYYYYHDGKKTASGSSLNRTDFWIAYYPKQTNPNETHQEMIKRKNSYLGKEVLITCNGKMLVVKVLDCGRFRDKEFSHLKRVADFSPALFSYFGGTTKQGVLQNVTIQLL